MTIERSVEFNVPADLQKLRQMKRASASVSDNIQMKDTHKKIVGDIWSNCGNSTDYLQIKNVTITPDPPKIGSPISVFASGQLRKHQTQSHLTISDLISLLS